MAMAEENTTHLRQDKPHTSYLAECFKDRATTIKRAVKRLKYLRRGGLQFDAIAFAGMSGCLMAPAIADKLGVGIMAIRKRGERTHADFTVEATPKCVTYIIVDDLVYSGQTVERIQDALGPEHCKGIYVYHATGGSRREIDALGKCLNAKGAKNIREPRE